MRNLVPLTKILLTLGTAVWAIVLHRPESLLTSVFWNFLSSSYPVNFSKI